MNLHSRKPGMPGRISAARVVLLYAAFGALWIVSSGALLKFTVADPLLQSCIEIAKGLVFVAVTSSLLYLLLQGWQERLSNATDMQPSAISPIKTSRLLSLFVAMALVVPLVGLVVVKTHGPQLERDAYANLEAVARLKGEQIENWLAERQGDGLGLIASHGFAEQVGQLLRQPSSARRTQPAKPILNRFESLHETYRYATILLFDDSGRLRLMLGNDDDDTPALQQQIHEALSSKQIQRGALYKDEQGRIHMDWVVPIYGSPWEGALATVVLRTTAQNFLYPLIQTWPTASDSAETLLVRREGASVIYLNDVRHKPGAALSMKRSLSDTELPAAIALRAASAGTTPGKDHRGTPVLAAYRPVAGTDWFIIAKVDRDEVLAPVHELAMWVSLVTFCALVALGIALLLLWRQQQRMQSLAFKIRSAELIEQSERGLQAITQSANDAIVTIDSTGNIAGWNPAAERMFGYTELEISGQLLAKLMPEQFRDHHAAGLKRVVAGGERHVIGKTVELVGLRNDGTEFPLELSLGQWQTADGWFCTANIRDITERKQAALALENASRKNETLLNTASDGIHILDTEGNVVQANAAFCGMLGYSMEEILSLNVAQFDVYFTPAELKTNIASLLKEGNARVIETRHRCRDGHVIEVEINVNALEIDGRPLIYASSRDITERKVAETRILRLSQFYAALSQCNQAIIHSASEQELFVALCSIVVRFGGIKMAWIGLIDPDTRQIQPAASFGTGTEYLQEIQLTLDDSSPFGGSPTAIALQQDQPFWCQDFQHDPATAPWHALGMQYGWGGVAALPLHRAGVVIGAFILYTHEINAFDEESRELLQEMAIDISFALDNFFHETVRKQMEESQTKSEARYRAVAQTANDAIITADGAGNIVSFNRSAETVFGYAEAEVLGQPLTLLMPQRYRDRHVAGMHRAQSGEESHIIGNTVELEGLHKNGSEFPLELSLARWETAEGWFFTGFIRDISARLQAEQELRIAATAFEAQEGIFVTDAHNIILRVNQAFTRLTGYSAEEVIGKKPDILKSGRHSKEFYQEMWESLKESGCWQGEIWNRYRNGEVHPGWLAITATTNAMGEVSNYVSTYYDITQTKEADEKIRLLAFYDALTGLPNRRLLLDRLQQALTASARHHNHGAILFLDLDNFKMLNDTQGHDVGDLLLVDVARRLQDCVRDGDTVARLGGDEFVVMLEELSEDAAQAATQAETVGEKMLGAISQPYLLAGYEHHSSTSLGICLFQDTDVTVEELLKRADAAMYQAKNAGRNTLRFYDPAMQAALETHTALEHDLRQALERGEFILHYQPQVDIASGRIMGVEALLRWQHPERGLVSPLQFIPLAEDTGLIVPIGEWVLRTACAQAKKWQELGFDALRVAVNLSARQFRHKEFIPTLARALADARLPVHMLELEITESLIMHDMTAVIALMNKIRAMGIRFSIDDFGTGYSSLSYLSRFPISTLKVDQSFVRDVTTSPDNAAIVKAIITMAHSLRMSVIAEGVETEGQLAFLEKHRCNEIQGYLFSKPIPAEDCTALLAEDRRLALASVRGETQQRTLLLVDDEDNVRSSLVRLLRGSGYRILTADSAKKGLELLALNEVGVILSDQRMPEMTGVEFLRRVKDLYPLTVRIVLSGYTELKSITDAINEGAVYKFLTKPWEDDQVRAAIEEAFTRYEITRENVRLHDEVNRANTELAYSNAELEQRVRETAEEIVHDVNALRISQEIMENLPVAVIGVDEQGMISIANRAADELFDAARLGTLLGCQAADRLPSPLMEGLQQEKAGETSFAVVLPNGQAGDVSMRCMGDRSQSTGKLLVITPDKGATHAA